MYNQKLVASLKANGKILREFKDTVYIPFGAEYSILLKNLNTVRALVSIFIDGQDMVEGGLVLNAGQEIDLERSIKNGNLLAGNRFKFIERTGAIENHRGIKLEDGLVRIEFQFEKVVQQVYSKWVPGHYEYDSYLSRRLTDGEFYAAKGIAATSVGAAGMLSSNAAPTLLNSVSATASIARSIPTNDVGITVPGSESNQKFSSVSSFAVEAEKHSIVLKLLGETAENIPVTAPITVKTVQKCSTCGTVNKAKSKFCTSCGTALLVL